MAEDGQPQSSPVWFLWHEGAVYIATEPDAPKVENVTHQRAAAFHLDGAQPGDLVVTTAADDLGRFSTTLRFTPRRQRVVPSL